MQGGLTRVQTHPPRMPKPQGARINSALPSSMAKRMFARPGGNGNGNGNGNASASSRSPPRAVATGSRGESFGGRSLPPQLPPPTLPPSFPPPFVQPPPPPPLLRSTSASTAPTITSPRIPSQPQANLRPPAPVPPRRIEEYEGNPRDSTFSNLSILQPPSSSDHHSTVPLLSHTLPVSQWTTEEKGKGPVTSSDSIGSAKRSVRKLPPIPGGQ